MGDKECQENELAALLSIFDDERLFVLSNHGSGGQFSVTVNIPCDLKIVYPSFLTDVQDEKPANGLEEKKALDVLKNIRHLPPINLNFDLPHNYPSTTIPNYTLSCKWLNPFNLTQLCNKLDELWKEQVGCEVLYEWFQTLKDDSLAILGVTSELLLDVSKSNTTGSNGSKETIDKRAVQDVGTMETLIASLIEYNEQEGRRIFNTTYIKCGVCFDEKPGSACIRFPVCGHTFCSVCMKDYFTVQIKEGAVKALLCPQEKCENQADPDMVRKLVDAELFDKYESLLLQRTLECMDDIVYCPRKTCQSPVLKETERDMGRCAVCSFVFCVLCNTTYHGAAKCPLRSKDLLKIREVYLNGTPEEREDIEKRYGKRTITKIIEEGYSEEWVERFAKNCPNCKANIQKLDGCNKMMCYSCRVNFCWLCKAILDNGDPYTHFSSASSKCNNKLFEGMEVEFNDSEDEDEWINFLI